MIHRRRPSSTVTLLVAVFLAISSLLPFWAGSEAGAAAPTGVEHASMHHHSSADAGPAGPSSSGACPQHETCSGQCCVGCAQCVVALPVSQDDPFLPLPEFRTTVVRLTLDGSSSFLDRPPRG